MALSDPTNVRVGLVRKQALLQRLAQQMAAKRGGPGKVAGMVRAAGGRAAGTGSQFQSAVNGRSPGTARVTLPFNLPANRARPAGFDPDQSGGNAWSPGPSLAPVMPSGPPAGAADTTALQAPAATGPAADPYADTTDTPVSYTSGGQAQYAAPNSPSGVDVDPGFWITPDPQASTSGMNNPYFMLNPVDQSAPLNQPAAPDPYTAMATAQMQRISRGGVRLI